MQPPLDELWPASVLIVHERGRALVPLQYLLFYKMIMHRFLPKGISLRLHFCLQYRTKCKAVVNRALLQHDCTALRLSAGASAMGFTALCPMLLS